MPFCPNCGKEVSEGVTFCPECGQRLKEGFTPEERQKYIEELETSVEGEKPPKKAKTTRRKLVGIIAGCIIGVFILIGIIGIVTAPEEQPTQIQPPPAETTEPVSPPAETTEPVSPPAETGPSATTGEKNALRQAKAYLDYSAFSYDGLVEQLEYEGFSHEQAVYGAKANGY